VLQRNVQDRRVHDSSTHTHQADEEAAGKPAEGQQDQVG
jgi:hypothetical protein